MSDSQDQDFFYETRKFKRRFKSVDQQLKISGLKHTETLIRSLTEKPIHKYESEGVIAYGGMKLITRVLDKDTHREMAQATLLNPDSDVMTVGRFIREARITANLEHPNIVPIYDIGIDGNNPYFTMKLIDGETLLDIMEQLRRGHPDYVARYKLNELLRIYRQVLSAISFAHTKGVIHLDLSPGNIVIGRYGEVLVLDWGLARVISEDAEDEFGATSESIEMDYNETLAQGTPGYMAPEQADANALGKGGVSTDIYALGAILYTILTYQVPVEGATVHDILLNTIEGKFTEPKARVKHSIPTSLNAVVMKAMACQPDQRYESVLALREDIDAYLFGRATGAESASMLTHFHLFVKRNWLGATLTTVIIVILAIFMANRLMDKWAIWHWSEPLYSVDMLNPIADEPIFTLCDSQNLVLKNNFIFKGKGIEIPANHALWLQPSVPPGDVYMQCDLSGTPNFDILWRCANVPRKPQDRYPAGTILRFTDTALYVLSSPYATPTSRVVSTCVFMELLKHSSDFCALQEKVSIVIQQLENELIVYRNKICLLALPLPYPPAVARPQFGIMTRDSSLVFERGNLRTVSVQSKFGPLMPANIFMAANANNWAFDTYLYVARNTDDVKLKTLALRSAYYLVLYRLQFFRHPFEALKRLQNEFTLSPELENELYAVKAELYWQYGKFSDALKMVELISDPSLRQTSARNLLEYKFRAPKNVKGALKTILNLEVMNDSPRS